MTSQEIEQRVLELFNDGFHCAESVLLAVAEACGGVPDGLPRAATCFGGGVGKTHEEMCGALAGGLMALGLTHGRDGKGMNWDKAAAAGARLRQDFISRFGASACKSVLAVLGQQDTGAKCKRLSGVTAAMTYELLQEATAGEEAPCCCGEARATGQ